MNKKPRTSPIRVLSLQSSADIGGTELMTWSVLRRIDSSRFSIDVCFLYGEGPVSKMYGREGFRVWHLRYGERSVVSVAHELAGILRLGNYDIVHIYGLRANLLGRILSRLAGIPRVIAAQRSVDAWRKWWHVWLDRLTSGLVSLYLANSFAAAERLRTVEHVPEWKIAVIHNGLDPAPFENADPHKVRRELGLDETARVIVCVANLRQPKGHDMLLAAASRLDSTATNWFLWLVGNGPLRQSLEAKAHELGLEDRISFLGRRRDIPDILAGADVFALASRWEGLPGAIMEAMASGLPVVATKVGGIPELVVDQVTGILVQPGDPAAFAVALRRLVADRGTAEAMGNAGRRRIVSQFAIEEKVKEQERVYRELCGR